MAVAGTYERDAGVETARGALFDEVAVEHCGEEGHARDGRGIVEDRVERAPWGELLERRGSCLSGMNKRRYNGIK